MKSYRVLFVKPTENNANFTSPCLDVPLGILYLSSFLKSKLGDIVETDIIDLRFEKTVEGPLREKIIKFNPDLIGISMLTDSRFFVDRYSCLIRELAPEAAVVIGGPEATYSFQELMEGHPEIDFAVLGEGEIIFSRLVRTLINGSDVKGVRGVASRNGRTIHLHEPETDIPDLDDLPFPDYGMLSFVKYWGERPLYSQMNGVLADKKYTHVISSRACPYGCIYCHDIFGKKFRTRSPENFVREMKWLVDSYGVREFHIVDDVFNLKRKRMHAILNLIIDQGLDIKIAFPNGLRADLLEPEDLDLLKRAGTYMVTFAIETASPRMQRIIKKNLNIEKVSENIKYAASIGLIVKGFFMLGFPGETPEEIKQTIDYALRSKLDLAHFFTVTPFPGTGLRELAMELYPDWRDEGQYHYHPDKSFYQQATGYNLNRSQKLAYLRFYFPFRLFKTFYKIPLKMMRLRNWALFALRVLKK